MLPNRTVRCPSLRLACVTAALVALVMPRGAGAQSASSARVEQLVKQAAREFAAGVEASAAARGGDAGRGFSPGDTMPMTLDRAVALALERNPDIAVQRLNPSIAALSVAGALAAYRPTVTSTVSEQHQTSPPITILTGGTRVQTTTTTANLGASQAIPVGGGSLAFAWNNNRIYTNSFFYNFDPAFNTTFSLQYTQPLVRGMRTDPAREQITVSRINRDMSDVQLRATIVNTVSNVRNAYWDLVFAVQSIDVARQSVELARRLVEDNKVQVKYGTMTTLDLTTASSQEASARHALVQAEGNRRIAELALKRVVVGGANDALWRATLEPTDRPAVTEQPIDIEAAARRALAERSDLRQARQQASANQAAYALLRDQVRPQVDLVAGYQLAGIGGTQVLRGDTFFGGLVIGTIPGTYGDALTSMWRRDFPTWTVGVNVSYPVGMSVARAAASRAALQNEQVETEIRQIEVQVVSEVTSAAIQVQNSYDQVATARVAAQVATERLDAEQKKFRAGMSTNYLVVQAQRDLADAENAVLQAEVGYRKALVEFERAQQTTLQSAGVTVVTTAAR